VKVQLHSTGAASRLPVLLLGHILPVFALVAPCQTGASPVSVPRGLSSRTASWGRGIAVVSQRKIVQRRQKAEGRRQRRSAGCAAVRERDVAEVPVCQSPSPRASEARSLKPAGSRGLQQPAKSEGAAGYRGPDSGRVFGGDATMASAGAVVVLTMKSCSPGRIMPSSRRARSAMNRGSSLRAST